MSCGLIFRGFHALEVEFFQLNLLHLRLGCHYTPVGCHGMPKPSHDGFAYELNFSFGAFYLTGYIQIYFRYCHERHLINIIKKVFTVIFSGLEIGKVFKSNT